MNFSGKSAGELAEEIFFSGATKDEFVKRKYRQHQKRASSSLLQKNKGQLTDTCNTE